MKNNTSPMMHSIKKINNSKGSIERDDELLFEEAFLFKGIVGNLDLFEGFPRTMVLFLDGFNIVEVFFDRLSTTWSVVEVSTIVLNVVFVFGSVGIVISMLEVNRWSRFVLPIVDDGVTLVFIIVMIIDVMLVVSNVRVSFTLDLIKSGVLLVIDNTVVSVSIDVVIIPVLANIDVGFEVDLMVVVVVIVVVY
jgi:hypothetical protein